MFSKKQREGQERTDELMERYKALNEQLESAKSTIQELQKTPDSPNLHQEKIQRYQDIINQNKKEMEAIVETMKEEGRFSNPKQNGM